ncbi:MAG: ribbon-helix-helix domain-containing protein [Coleofasciculus sp. S288]|nr:ribbon-helix-helix domain-containing protein [Coleofasciculus sp. S288]
MVKKQIDIPESLDEALKSLAQALGVSEEELILRALTEFLQAHQLRPQSSRIAALERFLALAKETSKTYRLPEGYRFNRDELYGEYNARLPEESMLQPPPHNPTQS